MASRHVFWSTLVAAAVVFMCLIITILFIWNTDTLAAVRSKRHIPHHPPHFMIESKFISASRETGEVYTETSSVTGEPITKTPHLGAESVSAAYFLDSLASLDVMRKGITPRPNNCSVSGTICDCSSLGLTKIPQDLPSFVRCTVLSMYNNSLVSVPSGAFLKYTALEILTLERNKIRKLHVNSFQGLSRLKHLFLRYNDLPMLNGTFPKGLFKPLQSLQVLNLQKTNANVKDEDLQYPDDVLAELPNLTDLFMDGLYNKTFGRGFQKMNNLGYLTLAGYSIGNCQIEIIRSETFQNLGMLKMLNISDCNLNGNFMDSQAFASLTNLETLDLSWNDNLNIVNLARVLEGWVNSRLKKLKINFIVSRYASHSPRIYPQYVVTLPDTLTELEAQANSIERIDGAVFAHLPQNLTQLDVSQNRFIFGCYLKNMSHMENLQRLILEGGHTIYSLPKEYPDCEDDVSSAAFKYSNCDSEDNETLVFHLPPNLNYLSMYNAGLSYRLTEVYVDPNNTLEHLIIDGNFFPELEGPIYGLNKLISISISYCRVRWISDTFFQNLTSLTSLYLGYNLIDLSGSDSGSPGPFKTLSNLKYLNLTLNSLTYLSPRIFESLDKLEELYLDNNPLWRFTANISHMANLRVLSLAKTTLTGLEKDTRSHIDWLIQSNISIRVDLSESYIACTCNNLEFLQWMATSKAFEESLSTKRYGCASDGIFVPVKDRYSQTLSDLRGECTSRFILFMVTLGGTVFLASAVIGLILYRFRWKLRYLYYAAYLSLKKKEIHQSSSHEFQFDVFVSYANDDEDFIEQEVLPELEGRGLKLLIHGRDFLAGEYIASNIVTAVQESRKTLVILTQALLKSAWCNYEIQMANMESVHSGRQTLVFLLKDSMSNKALGTQLLNHIRSNTYIPYPHSNKDNQTDRPFMEAFWDRLATGLQS